MTFVPFIRRAAGPENFKIWFLHFRAIRTVYHMWYFRNVSQIGHFMDNYLYNKATEIVFVREVLLLNYLTHLDMR